MREDFSPLAGGRAHRVLARAGFDRGDVRGVARTAAIVAVVTWGPLAVLAAAQGVFLADTVTVSFARDLATHVRLLVAVPLVLLADIVVGPQLTRTVRQLIEARLVSSDDAPRLEAALDEVLRRRDSDLAEVALTVLAYTFAWNATAMQASTGVSTWLTGSAATDGMHFTFAGWWYVLVSAPVFLFLSARWFWRGIVWGLFLARVAELDLGLVATHPDEAGGLAFMGQGQAAFGIIVFAYSSVLSALLAGRVMYGGAHVMDFKVLLGGFVVVAVAVVSSPLLVLVRPLGAARRTALARYSALLTAHNRTFERRWLDGREGAGDDLLGGPDASSVADLGAAFAAVQRMRLLPIDRLTMVVLAASAIAPMIPLVALEIPLKDIVMRLLSVLA